MISTILLAAGKSTRMGKTKQLLEFGKSTILGETIKNLLASQIDEIIIVLGHEAKNLKKSLKISNKKIIYVINKNYREGISTSIKCGILHANPVTDAYMIALADQPLIKTETINRLIDKYNTSQSGLATLIYKNKRGHPVIISKKYYKELLALTGDRGARELFNRHKDDISSVQVDSPEVILDIDNQEDYLELRSLNLSI